MKLVSQKLNPKALRNHFGLSHQQVKAVVAFADQHDLRGARLVVMESPEGQLTFAEGSGDAEYMEQTVPCMSVVRSLSKDLDPMVGHQITIPWKHLMKGAPDTGFMVYQIQLVSLPGLIKSVKIGAPTSSTVDFAKQHLLDRAEGKRVTLDGTKPDQALVYIGKTRKGLAVRLRQHIGSMVKGSATPFHRAMRGDSRTYPTIPIMTFVGSARTDEGAYDLEERHIERATLEPTVFCLNSMKNREAIQKLREQFPEAFKTADPEEAEELLFQSKQRMEKMWDDPTFAEAVICNNPRNFDYGEICQIRMMSRMGLPTTRIAKDLSASTPRIEKLLRGETYSRIS